MTLLSDIVRVFVLVFSTEVLLMLFLFLEFFLEEFFSLSSSLWRFGVDVESELNFCSAAMNEILFGPRGLDGFLFDDSILTRGLSESLTECKD